MRELALTFHYVQLVFVSENDALLNALSKYYRSLNQSQELKIPTVSWTIKLEAVDGNEAQFAKQAAAADSEESADVADDGTRTFAEFSIAGSPVFFAQRRFECNFSPESPLCLRVNIANRSVSAMLSGRFLQYEEAFLLEFMRDLLRKIIFPMSGLLVLHASVVSNNQGAVLLSGDKGAGKSTLALKLLQSGFRLTADDSPLIVQTPDGTAALNSLDRVSVTEGTLKLFPELVKYAGAKREISGKHILDREFLDESQYCLKPVPVRHIIALKRNPIAKARISRVPKMEMVARLLGESMILFGRREMQCRELGLKEASASSFALISGLVDSAQTHVLECSYEQLDEAIELITGLQTA